ncbi:MAG: 2-amino-4-hydroxy-6-hydroxymethyldihydropteridine diphosphokinase [Thermodesulfobacteriota bacterium]
MGVTAYVGFGSNLGDRRAKFEAACRLLGNIPGTRVTAVSRLFETEPVGLSDNGPKFVNGATALDTELPARELMKHMREIETALGKSPEHRSDLSREIDLDLLLYGEDRLTEEGLVIPHPRMHARAFVLVPLAEIAGHAVHPVLGQTVQWLLDKLPAHDVMHVTPVSG